MHFEDLTLVSLPDEDRPLADQHLPGARCEGAALQDVRSDGTTRILSVMIHDAVTPEALSAWPSLEAVVTRSGGHDHLPLDWMAANGIAAYHLGDYAADSVAELTVALLTVLVRRVPEATERTRRGAWDRVGLEGRRLTECTVGVLGTGAIGGRVVRQLHDLGVPVVAHDLVPDPDLAALEAVRYEDDLDRFLSFCDALSLHVPLDGSTRGLLDAPRIARVRPGAVLVNTARGEVLDPIALQDALGRGHLAGFAADVLPGEPDPPDLAALAQRPEVLVTPHLGAHNQDTLRRRYGTTATIAGALLAGEARKAARYRVDAGRME